MTRLACSGCGGSVSAVAPLAELSVEERLCPRCGAQLRAERRLLAERRLAERRVTDRDSILRRERRVTERRAVQRRSGFDPYRVNPFIATRTRWQTIQRPLDDTPAADAQTVR
jgi:hypothetical protein